MKGLGRVMSTHDFSYIYNNLTTPALGGSGRGWIYLSRALHRIHSSALKRSIRRFVITEKAHTRACSWLKAATTAFTFKTLFRHYAKWTLTPQ